MGSKLRVGLWAEQPARASVHERDFVAWAKSSDNVELLVIDAGSSTGSSEDDGALWPVLTLERRKLARIARFRDSMSTFDIGEAVSPSPDALRRLNLDIIVCLGRQPPPDAVAATGRLGVLSFGWCERKDGCTPVGFWEVLEQHETSSFSLRLGGRVLMRGRVPTRHFFLLNRAALFAKANHYLRELVGLIADGNTPQAQPGLPDDAPSRPRPGVLQVWRYLVQTTAASIAKKIDALRGREAHWHVAFAPTSWREAELARGNAIPNPRGHYLADPFLVHRDGRAYCFVEDYDCEAQRGFIGAYELADEGPKALGPVIEEPFHMSFPFVFEYGGELYMCPETSANRDIRIYKCIDFPMKWQFERSIMTSVRAADTMLLERDGRWWMLTNLDPAESGEICSELYVFSAESPLSTRWEPHPGNPVVFDAAYARNGGLLFDQGKVFRVSQRQGFDRYGKGSQINEIVTLNATRYEECTIQRIDAVFWPELLGTHHMHSHGDMTVFDFARTRA